MSPNISATPSISILITDLAPITSFEPADGSRGPIPLSLTHPDGTTELQPVK